MRAIAVVTTSRADYGIFRPLLRAISSEPSLRLHLVVSGMHLLEEFGFTVREIEADGFPIAERLNTLEQADDPPAVVRSMARALQEFGAAFARMRPDLLVVLGDRYEMQPAALAALPFQIPVAHIHGGEVTEGAIDEPLRHCITKLSHLHFAATPAYAQRIVQMGEEPWRVHCTGALGLDAVVAMEPMTREQLRSDCGIDLPEEFLLVVYHPATLAEMPPDAQFAHLSRALEKMAMPVLMIGPNADTGGRLLLERMRDFVLTRNWARMVENLPSRAYLSAMRLATAMVGNSSSGIIETGVFGLPVVNIGTRQAGRVRGPNVLDVACDADAILIALRRAVGREFRESLRGKKHPYGRGDAAPRILRVLRDTPLDRRLLVKRFADLPIENGSLSSTTCPERASE